MLGTHTRRRILSAAAVFGLVAFGTLSATTAASAAPTPDVVIDTPLDGAVLDSTDFVFSGTAPVGTGIVYSFFGTSEVSAPVFVGVDGGWTFTVHVPRGGDPVQLGAIGVNPDNTPLGSDSITITPAPYLAAPVVVSPANDTTVATSAVTIRGTAIPDSVVSVVVLDADVASDASWCDGYVVSDANGDWSLDCTLPNLNFVAIANLVSEIPAEGQEPETVEQTSLATFSFFSVAAPTVPAAVPAAPGTPAQLAATGASTSAPVAAGALLLLIGAAALMAARRRSGMLSAV